MTNKLSSVRLGYLADSLLKMNKASLSFERKQCLLSIIKFKLSNENQNFGNLCLLLWAWQLFYKDFFDETGVILMQVILWYHIMKHVNLWKTCVTQWPNIFQCMMTAKSCISKKNPFKGLQRPMDFNVTEYENFINMTSDCTLLLTFKKSPIFEFGVVFKENIHTYLKRLLKYSSLFQL